MIKMNYPERITLLTLSQPHLLASKITMAQEIVEAAPSMTPTQIAHRNNRDKAIRRNNCTFLLRIRLLKPVRDLLTAKANGVYSVPSFFTDDVNEHARLSAFLTDDVKVQIVAKDLIRCVAFEPNGHFTTVKVLIAANGVYNFVVPWRAMLQRCEVEEKAVLSMWGFYEDGMLRFIFRHDGYASPGEELPPLTDMTVVDPEPEQDDHNTNQQQGGNCCNVG